MLECWDRRRKEYVAVKIVRNVDKYRHAAMIEVGSARRRRPRMEPCLWRLQLCNMRAGAEPALQQKFRTCIAMWGHAFDHPLLPARPPAA